MIIERHKTLLDELLEAYKNSNLDKDTPYELIEESLSKVLRLLCVLHSENSNNDPLPKCIGGYSEVLGRILKKRSLFEERDFECSTTQTGNNAIIRVILNLNRARNESYRRKIFPNAHKKLKNLKNLKIDYLNITNKITNENAHSDIIAALADANRCPNISSKFLAMLLKASLHNSPNFEKEEILASGKKIIISKEINRIIELLKTGELFSTSIREKSIGNGNNNKKNMRIDILIKNQAINIAIENKVYSFEHDSQTVEYYKWLKENCVGDVLPVGILLSPTRMSPKCKHFGILGFEDVKWSLVAAICEDKVTNEEFLLGRSYLNSLEFLLQ